MKKKYEGLVIAIFLCNFGLSHVGDQTTKTFFFSPNFVYSVIINQSPDTTVFWAQEDKKMWRNYSGKKTEKEKKCPGEEDLTEIESKVDLEHTSLYAPFFVSFHVCDWTQLSESALAEGHGCRASSSEDAATTTTTPTKRWLQSQTYVT